MTYTARVSVERTVIVDGDVALPLCAHASMVTSLESGMKQPITIKSIRGRAEATVSVTADEKLSHPTAYSSVSVSVGVTISCNQDKDSMTEAARLAYELAITQVDAEISTSWDLLIGHLEHLGANRSHE